MFPEAKAEHVSVWLATTCGREGGETVGWSHITMVTRWDWDHELFPWKEKIYPESEGLWLCVSAWRLRKKSLHNTKGIKALLLRVHVSVLYKEILSRVVTHQVSVKTKGQVFQQVRKTGLQLMSICTFGLLQVQLGLCFQTIRSHFNYCCFIIWLTLSFRSPSEQRLRPLRCFEPAP